MVAVAQPTSITECPHRPNDGSALPVSTRLVHFGTKIDLTELRDQLVAIREACDRIEGGDIMQDFEFGRASDFINVNARVQVEYDLWINSARTAGEHELRSNILLPVARAMNVVRNLTWCVWNNLPNHESNKAADEARLPSSLARLRVVIGIGVSRLENLG